MIRTVSETGSTSTDLAARLGRGELVPEGEWLVADRQTAGRGRMGRGWIDGAGNFMGSTVVHRLAGDPPSPTVALMSGLAVHAAVSRYLPEPGSAMLKWPNDVLIAEATGMPAKIGGVLLETAGDAIVVGIGVNLAAAPDLPDRRATALAMHTATPPERDGFAHDLATVFAAELSRWRQFGLGALVARWQSMAHPAGTRLNVSEPGGAGLSGTFQGLTGEGALCLRLDDGTMRVIQSGEVTIGDPA